MTPKDELSVNCVLVVVILLTGHIQNEHNLSVLLGRASGFGYLL